MIGGAFLYSGIGWESKQHAGGSPAGHQRLGDS